MRDDAAIDFVAFAAAIFSTSATIAARSDES
jgi:hypothetical protein